MKRITILLAGAAMIASLASCNKDNGVITDPANESTPISVMSGIDTKGYVDGTTFYEKATATMHQTHDSTARTMRLSAYRSPDKGQTFAAGNYFVNALFEADGGTPKQLWRHNPAYYWPLSSVMTFLGISSTEPFAAKDAKWDAADASNKVTLTFDRSRCQDDVLYAAQKMKSENATATGYVTGQPVNMTFSHAQAWIEFQFSVATDEMKDKIAIKEIVLEEAFDSGVLTVTRELDGENTIATGSWATGVSSNIIFDDNYGVYGHSKTVDEYTAENAAVAAKQQALAEAEASGNADAIATAEADLKAAEDALALAVAQYPVVNALNAVGVENTSSTPASGAEVRTDCSFFDMLLPEQPKANIIIRYVLAGRPNVLEYKYTLKSSGNNWVKGNKYIYDIDFVISEITVAPTVKEWIASFDGSDLSPVELI